ETRWCRLDVDREHLLHRLILQSALERTQGRGPGCGVLAHPPVVDESDRDGVQEVQLLAPPLLRHHETRIFEHAQVLHHAEAGHREAPLECAERLTVLLEELVEQATPRRRSQSPEDRFHGVRLYVTIQSPVNPASSVPPGGSAASASGRARLLASAPAPGAGPRRAAARAGSAPRSADTAASSP